MVDLDGELMFDCLSLRGSNIADSKLTHPKRRMQQACRHDDLVRRACSSNLHNLPMCVSFGVLSPTAVSQRNTEFIQTIKKKIRETQGRNKSKTIYNLELHHFFSNFCRIHGDEMIENFFLQIFSWEKMIRRSWGPGVISGLMAGCIKNNSFLMKQGVRGGFIFIV